MASEGLISLGSCKDDENGHGRADTRGTLTSKVLKFRCRVSWFIQDVQRQLSLKGQLARKELRHKDGPEGLTEARSWD